VVLNQVAVLRLKGHGGARNPIPYRCRIIITGVFLKMPAPVTTTEEIRTGACI